MLKSEVIEGESYVVGGYAMGRAVAVSAPRKQKYSERIYEVDIEYVDASEEIPEYRRKATVPIKDIRKKWGEQEENMFKRQRERIEMERGWKQTLAEAGYPCQLRYDAEDDEFWISFDGLVAEKVIMKLTGEEIPPRPTLNDQSEAVLENK